MTAKPLSIKGTGCKSGGCVRKAVELTSGALAVCPGIGTEGGAIHPDRAAAARWNFALTWSSKLTTETQVKGAAQQCAAPFACVPSIFDSLGVKVPLTT